jgi:hypothetical protein
VEDVAMIMSVLRVLVAFGLACIAGALVQLGFATPFDVLTDDPDRLSWSLEQALLAATHGAVFSAPFALVAAAIGEWQSIRSWVYYVLAGIAIAIAGFIAIYSVEATTANSIVNQYATIAYLASGLVAGWVYWLFSGRFAGDAVEAEIQARGTNRSGSTTQGRA